MNRFRYVFLDPYFVIDKSRCTHSRDNNHILAIIVKFSVIFWIRILQTSNNLSKYAKIWKKNFKMSFYSSKIFYNFLTCIFFLNRLTRQNCRPFFSATIQKPPNQIVALYFRSPYFRILSLIHVRPILGLNSN